jgi:5,5'-dehydrodivanillate O-demethylase
MATTQEQNERLTRVGPGTPMGNLLRRYWHVAGFVTELEQDPVRRVRLLGEDLTLFRTERGGYGLIGDLCPHRCMSLEYGIPDQEGLRCAYHGWLWAADGRCLEQPFEEYTNPEARFKDKVRITSYPVQELSGMLWAYLGPAPAPLLPRWDLLVRDDLDAMIEVHELPCNWLQCMDNSLDPIHFEHLHATFGNYQLKKLGRPAAMFPAKHVKIAFDLFEYGVYKRRLLEGESEDIDDWQIGHPVLFPSILAVGEEHHPRLQIRVPVDDVNTTHIRYRTKLKEPGPRGPLKVRRTPLFNEDGKIIGDSIPNQDELAWIAQGPVSQRTREHLGAGDVGVIMYHKLLHEQMDKVARGEDPLGIIRDPAINEPMIRIRRERKGYEAFRSTYRPTEERFEELASTTPTR